MTNHETGEEARPLTPRMLQELHRMYTHRVHGCTIGNVAVAVCMLNRGFIAPVGHGEVPHTLTMYRITEHGIRAYRIAAKLAGVSIDEVTA